MGRFNNYIHSTVPFVKLHWFVLWKNNHQNICNDLCIMEAQENFRLCFIHSIFFELEIHNKAIFIDKYLPFWVGKFIPFTFTFTKNVFWFILHLFIYFSLLFLLHYVNFFYLKKFIIQLIYSLDEICL